MLKEAQPSVAILPVTLTLARVIPIDVPLVGTYNTHKDAATTSERLHDHKTKIQVTTQTADETTRVNHRRLTKKETKAEGLPVCRIWHGVRQHDHLIIGSLILSFSTPLSCYVSNAKFDSGWGLIIP